MLSPIRSPLGAPGVFALPDLRPPSLHPQRMDVCAFAGVAPRGPAREPVVDSDWPSGYAMVTDVARPLRHSVPVMVRSFDEYVSHFGAFEGPGMLPQAVASYFEQGGRLAWILRIVHDRGGIFSDGCSTAAVSGFFTTPVGFIARSEGSWGDNLRVALAFDTTMLSFTLDAASRICLDLTTGVQPGATLRVTDATGFSLLTVCNSMSRLRDPAKARDQLVLDLSVTPPNPPAFVELVEVEIGITDGASANESFDHLSLRADHPRSLSNVLCNESRLVWPDPAWAAGTLTPADVRVELLTAATGFTGGADNWDQIVPQDFFDPDWSVADETGGNGITALVDVPSITQWAVPDLYVPAQWAGLEEVAAVPEGSAGAEFSPCVMIPAVPAATSVPPSALTGLVLDPRTQAGLDAIIALQQQMVDFCEATQNDIALLDVPPGLSQARIEYWRARFDTSYAAAYHPWLVPTRGSLDTLGSDFGQERRIPPSAVAAGIIARRELERGIQYGPANEVAREIIHVAEPQPPGRADVLHVINLNCFVREQQGISLINARTLSRESDWRQLSVRRLMLMLRRTLLAQMQWAVFEPNGPRLWRDIQNAVTSLLRGLFRVGAFAGATEAQSFFVRIDTSSNRLDNGQLLVEIGVAPAEPLEFILVRLRRDGDGTLNFEE